MSVVFIKNNDNNNFNVYSMAWKDGEETYLCHQRNSGEACQGKKGDTWWSGTIASGEAIYQGLAANAFDDDKGYPAGNALFYECCWCSTTPQVVLNRMNSLHMHLIWSSDDSWRSINRKYIYIQGYPRNYVGIGSGKYHWDFSIFNDLDEEATLNKIYSYAASAFTLKPETSLKVCNTLKIINKTGNYFSFMPTYSCLSANGTSVDTSCECLTFEGNSSRTKFIPTYIQSKMAIKNEGEGETIVRIFSSANGSSYKEYTLSSYEMKENINFTPTDFSGTTCESTIYIVVTDKNDKDDDFFRAYYITGAGKYVSELMSDSGYCDLYFKQGSDYIFTKFEGNGWKPSDYCWSPDVRMLAENYYVSDNANVGLALKTNKDGTGLAYVKSNFYATKPFTKFNDTFSDDYIICPCAFHSPTGHMDLFMYSTGTTTPTKIGDYNPENGNNTMTGQFTYGVCVPCYKASNECDSNITVNMYGWDLPNDKEKYALPVGYNTFIEITNNTSSIQKIYSYSGHLLCTINPGEYYTAEFGGDCKTYYDYTFTNVPSNNCYVYSATDNKWHEALAYVYVGGTWKEAVPYVYNGSEWKNTSC